MTESEKIEALAMLKSWEENADKMGLYATAQSWRDTYDSVKARPATDIVLAKHKLDKPATANSKQKGKRRVTQFAHFLKERGVEARRGQQFSGGDDSPDVVHNIPGIHFEVQEKVTPAGRLKGTKVAGTKWKAAMGSKERRNQRELIYEKQDGACFWCKAELQLCCWWGDDYATLDEVIPRSYGGRKTIKNTVIACRRCNGVRGAWTDDRKKNKSTTALLVRN